MGLLGPWVCRARGSGRPVGLVGLWVWWARGSGGFCWVLNDKSPTLKGSDMPSVLGLVLLIIWIMLMIIVMIIVMIMKSIIVQIASR